MSSLEKTSKGWMPPSPSKMLRRLSLRGTASNAAASDAEVFQAGLSSSAAPAAAPASPSLQINRLFGRSAPSPPTSPMKRSKAPWLSTAGGGRTPGVDEGAEPRAPMKRLKELRQQLGRSGKLTDTDTAAASSLFHVGTPEARVARPVAAESKLAEKVAARVTPALAGKRLDGTVARANAAKPEPGSSPPGRPRVEVVAAVQPVFHPHFVRPLSTVLVPPPWAAAPPSAAQSRASSTAAQQSAAAWSPRRSRRGPTCRTYDEERNTLRQGRLEGVRQAALSRAPRASAVRVSEPSAVAAVLATLARETSDSPSHKNAQQAYRDVLASAASEALKELGRLEGQDAMQKAAAAATAADISSLVECFAEADADMSGQIEESEWPTALEAMHRLWPSEPRSMAEVAGSGFSGTHERRTGAQHVFTQLDLDRDGRVSFSEFVLHRQRQHWVRLRAQKALSTKSEARVAAERLVAVRVNSSITQMSHLVQAESMRGWGG